MEVLSESKNLARVSAGFKGGPFNQNPLTAKPMTFVDGWPPEVRAKMQMEKTVQSTPIDVWSTRHGK